jgi:hypothetical protein
MDCASFLHVTLISRIAGNIPVAIGGAEASGWPPQGPRVRLSRPYTLIIIVVLVRKGG